MPLLGTRVQIFRLKTNFVSNMFRMLLCDSPLVGSVTDSPIYYLKKRNVV